MMGENLIISGRVPRMRENMIDMAFLVVSIECTGFGAGEKGEVIAGGELGSFADIFLDPVCTFFHCPDVLYELKDLLPCNFPALV